MNLHVVHQLCSWLYERHPITQHAHDMVCMLPGRGGHAASQVGLSEDEVRGAMGGPLRLPSVNVADQELQDARWFHRAWLLSHVSGKHRAEAQFGHDLRSAPSRLAAYSLPVPFLFKVLQATA